MRRAEGQRGLTRLIWLRRPVIGLLALTFLVIGLAGTTSYWEAYYQHRGFTAPARVAHALPGRLLTVHFYSRALGRQADYLVYLPSGYDASVRYPAVYLLHGTPGGPRNFIDIANAGIRLDNLIAQHRAPPMILVFPDGRIGRNSFSDSEWANSHSGRFETYLLDVVHDVDGRFATIANRSDRVIGGYSEGGYGALNLALHHLGMFGSVQVWSGYFVQSRSGVFAHATRAQLAYNSPLSYVRQLHGAFATLPLRVFVWGGRVDSGSKQIPAMDRALVAAGAQARSAIYPGGHDWQLWTGHMSQMLVLAGRDVLSPPAVG